MLLLLCAPLTTVGNAWICGDVDRNGMCGTSDVRELLKYTIGVAALDEQQLTLADHNEDGKVDSADARAILFAVTNGEEEKPCEQLLLRANAYNGEPFVMLNGNMPLFTEDEKQTAQVFETYVPLDEYGRCGTAYANICVDLMPTEDRDSISSVTPTGWHNKQYDHIAGGWVYNRAHIIGFQLAGEQANKQNLITGTRYLNTEGMLPFENMIADYVKETEHHVLYRVTPVFYGNNLLAEGVRMEAWSVEDNGEGICFHVFCYNVQPGVVLDYATGENHAADDEPVTETVYILNLSSKKFHYADCGNALSISDQNRQEYMGNREDLIAQGYTPCGNCDP